jgi:HD-like signal output (HDOD) protein
MKQYQDFYHFGLWVFDCLDMTKPKMEMHDIIDIVEYISPESYEELAETIIKNAFLKNPDDYLQDKNIIWNNIIKYMILSFEKNDMKLFDEKCKLLEFVIERKN